MPPAPSSPQLLQLLSTLWFPWSRCSEQKEGMMGLGQKHRSRWAEAQIQVGRRGYMPGGQEKLHAR